MRTFKLTKITVARTQTLTLLLFSSRTFVFSLPFVMSACWFRWVVEIIFFVVSCSFTCKNPYSDRLDMCSYEGAGMLQTHLMLINVSCCRFFLSLRRLCCYCRRFRGTRERTGAMVLVTVAAVVAFCASDTLPTCISMLTMMTTTMMMLMMVCIYMRFVRQCQTKKPCTCTCKHNIIIFQILFFAAVVMVLRTVWCYFVCDFATR